MDQKNFVKSQLEPYLAARGLSLKKPFNCLNPDHPDKNPSMSLDRRRNKVHCFACGADYDIFDLVGLERGLTDPAEIFSRTYEMFGVEVGDRRSEGGRGRQAVKRIQSSAYTQTAAKPAPKTKAAAKSSLTVSQAVPPADSSLAAKQSPVGEQCSLNSAEPPEDHRRSDGVKPLRGYLAECRGRLGQTDYPSRRGLSADICERFGLGFDPSFPAGGEVRWAALIIPTGPDSFTARNTDPEADKGSRIRKKGASPVYNADILWDGSDQPAFVVEGEIDALAVYEAGFEAVALGSTANAGAFLKMVEASPPVRGLILALDNDEGGSRAAAELEVGLTALRTPFFQADPYGEGKDAGEALLGDPGAFSEALLAAARIGDQAAEAEREAYLATCAARHLDAFRDIFAGVDTPALPTGFQVLDKTLDGGLFEGFYVVGGISSLGKTTLVTQLADQVAQSGRNVLIFSLEMARRELMAKSLSRLTILSALAGGLTGALAKTARGITCGSRYARYSGAELRLIGQAIDQYAEYSNKIFISEGVGDIGANQVRLEVEKHLRFTGNRPVVIIDYLQILAPPSERSTDKQNVDKNVLELKRLSRDFKIPVIGLSSFNRANYREAVTMEAFKESGAIEYSSDVLLGLQLKGAGDKDFDALAEKERNPRRVELVVLKNRQGPAGGRVEFEYYPMFNYFKECTP